MSTRPWTVGQPALADTHFDAVADVSKTPGALEVAEPRIGCCWSAITL